MFLLKNYNQNSLINELENNDNKKELTDFNPIKKLDKDRDRRNTKVSQLPLTEIVITVRKNDTFSKILKPFIKDDSLQNKIIQKINKKFNLKTLNINQKIFFYKNEDDRVNIIIIPINFFTELMIELNDSDVIVYNKKTKFKKEINSLEFNINSSLYEDGIAAGLPLIILNNAIKLYSFDLDFQRDIKKNTTFQISYEKLFNENRNEITYGNIEYINLIIENKKIEYFIFKNSDGLFDYFTNEGKNVKKSLLKTPIDGAKLSSNFGMRKHPISGYTKLHKGVDFAAPTGTPIYAGGNGVVEFVGKNGGYGNYIRIRHNNEYKTAYAHLSSFKKGITTGKRVNQREIIGYVGSTGKSTGPHLHYEIIFQEKQINPMKMKLPSGKILKGRELKEFKIKAKNIYARYLFTLYE
jgi:murein DD-endopeptidase MepM/ murein hydrolase activator NlpD